MIYIQIWAGGHCRQCYKSWSAGSDGIYESYCKVLSKVLRAPCYLSCGKQINPIGKPMPNRRSKAKLPTSLPRATARAAGRRTVHVGTCSRFERSTGLAQQPRQQPYIWTRNARLNGLCRRKQTPRTARAPPPPPGYPARAAKGKAFPLLGPSTQTRRSALPAAPSRRRDCHFTDTHSQSILRHLLMVEGGCRRMTVSPMASHAALRNSPNSSLPLERTRNIISDRVSNCESKCRIARSACWHVCGCSRAVAVEVGKER